MKKQSILACIIVIMTGTSVHSADWQVDWVDGSNIPISWEWSIYPSHFPPSPPFPLPGTIPFSGPTGVFSNNCYAASDLGGTPTITIDPYQKTIELWFQPPAPNDCWDVWLPVCGLNGWFGPLIGGDWLFYSDQIPSPYGPFYINFHVDGPLPTLTILNPNGDEYLAVGSTYTIRWEDSRSGSCGGNYLLDYSIDDGNNWIPVASNTISNTCSYDWLVPSISSNQCLIRITDANDPNLSDESDDSFRILQCQGAVLGDWNGDRYVDFDDFSIIAASWNVPGGMDINDLATLVQYWLDCANPYDPSCSFGEAMPDFPPDGVVIDGDKVYDNIYTSLIFVPGATAAEHKGYFNEDYSKVASRHPDANLGSPPFGDFEGYEYTFWVGNPGVPPITDSLVRGTKYYWTVDETDALGNTFAGDIWEFTIHDFKATSPNPPNEATFIGTDVLLSWQPGYIVEEHDIYLGTSWEDVKNAVYQKYNQPPEFVATVEEPNILVTGLLDNTTYYWRVDQVYDRRDMFPPLPMYYKGDVWCFTTISGSAEPNFPADGTVIPGDTITYLGYDYIFTRLIFIPGPTAVKHTGYFSKVRNEVANRVEDANLCRGWDYSCIYPPWPENEFIVGLPDLPPYESLIRGQIYYWTVDAEDALGNIFPGDIREFTIQSYCAYEPSPADGANDVVPNVLLSWQPGYYVEEHDIYMGTSWEDVNNAVFDAYNQPPEFVETRSEPNYQVVTALPYNTKYYWRVDEVVGRGPPDFKPREFYKGDVWCFTTAPSALNNDGSINFKDYTIPSNYRQKAGPIPPYIFVKMMLLTI